MPTDAKPTNDAPASTTQADTEDPDQVAVLQDVVETLATPAPPVPRSGYTPRVFAFERPPKDGSGARSAPPQSTAAPGTPPAVPTGQAPGVAEPGAAPAETSDVTKAAPVRDTPGPDTPDPAASEPAAPVPSSGSAVPQPEAAQIPIKPLTGAIQRVAHPMGATGGGPVSSDGTSSTAGGEGPSAPDALTSPGAGERPFFGLAGDGAPSRGPRIALFSVLGAVVLFAIYAVVAWSLSDTAPRETMVAGVDVGGMTQAEAATALTDRLASRVKEPIQLTAGQGKAQLSPEPSGLAIDAEATAAQLTGFSLSPVRMWAHAFGGGEVELLLDIDDEKLDAAVAGLEGSLAVEPVDGTVAFVDGQPVKTDPKEGSRVVASETSRIIRERWIEQAGPFALPVEPVPPAITQKLTDETFALAQNVVSAPVHVSVGGQNPELAPEVLATLVRFEQRDSELVTIVDQEAAVTAIVNRTTDLLEVPDDAHFEFVGGVPTVVAGTTGTTLDPAQTAEAVRVAATSDARETSVELVEQDPEETVESLEALGVKEVVSEFHTPLTNESVRTQNLVRGAQMITGDLIKPGETFSLLEALAPITLDNGYFDAGVVENGKHVEAVGGGLSQMATTTFNAGFFAGYEDVEHHAHSYWFPRYPPGREATIYVGAKDMKFTNDTPYGAVLQSYVAGDELWVRIWSTEHYEVVPSDSGRRNIVPTTVIHDSSAECKPYPGGEDGFSISISRKVYLGDELAKENSFNHSYKPDNPVVCDGR